MCMSCNISWVMGENELALINFKRKSRTSLKRIFTGAHDVLKWTQDIRYDTMDGKYKTVDRNGSNKTATRC